MSAMPAEERCAAWERSRHRLDIAHHLANLRTYESNAAPHVPGLDAAEAAYVRSLIEGHAIRAVVALLIWGLES